MTAEIWKAWPRDPYYEVSNLGRVKSTRGVLRQFVGKVDRPSKQGYLCISKRRNSPAKAGRQVVHVMVCETFHGSRPPGLQAAHVDGDYRNNAAENVLWTTAKVNNHDHCIAQGREGKRLPYKLTDDNLNEMEICYVSRNLPVMQIARQFGVCPKTVRQHVKKRGWKRSA